MAKKSHEYHLEMVKRCTTQWRRIAELQGMTVLSPEEEEELSRLKQLFSLTTGADYQMSKLVPSWGMSPQPGSTKLRDRGGLELCRCLPNNRTLEPLTAVALPSPAVLKERVGTASTYISPLQCDSDMNTVVSLLASYPGSN